MCQLTVEPRRDGEFFDEPVVGRRTLSAVTRRPEGIVARLGRQHVGQPLRPLRRCASVSDGQAPADLLDARIDSGVAAAYYRLRHSPSTDHHGARAFSGFTAEPYVLVSPPGPARNRLKQKREFQMVTRPALENASDVFPEMSQGARAYRIHEGPLCAWLTPIAVEVQTGPSPYGRRDGRVGDDRSQLPCLRSRRKAGLSPLRTGTPTLAHPK